MQSFRAIPVSSLLQAHRDALTSVTTALSSGVDVRIMRYEDDKTSTSCAGATDAGAG
jgi:hypothetical protein